MITLPILELYVLIKVGNIFGAWQTILIVLCTAVLGALLARHEGLKTWHHAQKELLSGRVPSNSLLEGLLILLGGFVLLFPGLITDLFGFLLLIPFFRHFIVRRMQRALPTWMNNRSFVHTQYSSRKSDEESESSSTLLK